MPRRLSLGLGPVRPCSSVSLLLWEAVLLFHLDIDCLGNLSPSRRCRLTECVISSEELTKYLTPSGFRRLITSIEI